jgi:hypothetical protein
MLNLSWNGLGKEGCIALARSLPKNTSLQNLDLTNNRIDVVALPFLLHGLVRNTSIQSLNVTISVFAVILYPAKKLIINFQVNYILFMKI